MTPDSVVAAARAAIGTPFVHQGRAPGVGLDCAGLVVQVARAHGAAYADDGSYARTPAHGLLEAALDRQSCLVRVDDGSPASRLEPRAGDVLLLRFAGEPQHLAICTGDGMIHAWASVGRVCEHRLGGAWRSRIVRVYRFAGVVS